MKINTQAVQQAIQISDFKNPNLLEIALTHPSRIYESHINRQQQDEQAREYRRLSILGDTILAATVVDYLHNEYEFFNQSQITDIKSNIVSRKNCYTFAKKLNLKTLCLLGGSEQNKGENQQTELFAEMFEALLGAVYLNYERDFSLTKKWLIKLFIKDAVNKIRSSGQIKEEMPSTDCLQALNLINGEDSYKLWQEKEEIDALVAQDDKLQNLLLWICEKSPLGAFNYQPMQIRGFYIAFIRVLVFGLLRNCDPTINNNSQVRNFFDSFNRVNNLGLDISLKFNYNSDPANIIASILLLDIEPEIKQALKELKTELPNPKKDISRSAEKFTSM
ncbi:hypothetical protein H6G76_35920 [Nostoc sp. FACHB-152]|uniref:ribonuclease III domain-containing protein n=1 Tax=Nostoc sp. FACHB-152 TaxID=2692837 RepID=UPI0016860F64|nr:ribonuclease III domain-containing protein [Nostoc sp. FACHB-152]MBD2452393.1 hypothetical protein [Nostoc sp. FACHB-152]